MRRGAKRCTASVLAFAAVMVGGGACGSEEVDPLAPKETIAADVLSWGTEPLDVDLTDEEGRSYPARIYYNKAAEARARELAPRITVLTQLPEGWGRASSGERARGTPSDEGYPEDGPRVYVKIGPTDHGTRTYGWRAPMEALSNPTSPAPALPADGSEEGGSGPTYGALYEYTYTFFVQSSGNGGPTAENEFAVQCEDGAAVSQQTNFVSSGNGELILRDTATSLQWDTENYSGGSDIAAVLAEDNNADRWWYPRNEWRSGGTGGSAAGASCCGCCGTHFSCIVN